MSERYLEVLIIILVCTALARQGFETLYDDCPSITEPTRVDGAKAASSDVLIANLGVNIGSDVATFMLDKALHCLVDLL